MGHFSHLIRGDCGTALGHPFRRPTLRADFRLVPGAVGLPDHASAIVNSAAAENGGPVGTALVSRMTEMLAKCDG